MTDLAVTDAAGRAAVDDQPDPDPGAHGHIGEILKAPAAAPADFGQRGTVDVGVETDRHGESRLQRSEQIGALPVALVRRRSEEHTSELQSLMRISSAGFC